MLGRTGLEEKALVSSSAARPAAAAAPPDDGNASAWPKSAILC
jgi:hypothetical protein